MSMINVPDNVHKMLIEKQSDLYKKDNKKTNISDIAGRAIIKGINLI